MDSRDGGELDLADQLDYSTFHLVFFINFYFNLNINNLTWELEVPGTWELRNLGTRELRNLKFRELGNFGTWELRNSGTSELGNFGTLGTSELGNFRAWELRNFETSELGNSLSGVPILFTIFIHITCGRATRMFRRL